MGSSMRNLKWGGLPAPLHPLSRARRQLPVCSITLCGLHSVVCLWLLDGAQPRPCVSYPSHGGLLHGPTAHSAICFWPGAMLGLQLPPTEEQGSVLFRRHPLPPALPFAVREPRQPQLGGPETPFSLTSQHFHCPRRHRAGEGGGR